MKYEELKTILDYINTNYEIHAEIEEIFDKQNIFFINKKSSYPLCSFHFGICPEIGFAPGKLLMYCSKENKSHCGSGWASIYKGYETIDDFLKNSGVEKRKTKQLTIFDCM